MLKVRMIVRITAIVAVAAVLLPPPSALAQKERSFEARRIEYNVNASPRMSFKKFKSRISVQERGGVKVVTLKNFVSKKSKPDVTIKIALSSGTVASQIFNSEGKIIMEYPKGEYVNKNLYVFRRSLDKRETVGSWFISDDYLMSDFSMRDQNGFLLFKETVIYNLKETVIYNLN